METCIDTIFFGQVCDKCDGGSIYKILALIIKILTTGVGVIAVLGIIIAGVIYLTSGDNAERMAKAKKRIFEVIIGLIVYGVMFTVLQFLIPGGVIGSTLDSSTSSCPTPPAENNSGSGSSGSGSSSKSSSGSGSSSGSENSGSGDSSASRNSSSGSDPQSSSGQATTHYDKKSNTVEKGSNGLSYVLHVPEGATNNMPLVVFMHGSGETNSSKAVLGTAAVKAMDNSTKYPDTNKFIAISPIQPDYKKNGSSYDFGDANTLSRTKALIDEVANKYQVDKSRIYIIGFSMGAAQTWCMVNQNPNYFSAAVPISLSPKYNCAGSAPSASNFTHTKIWAMSGGSEDYYNKTKTFVDKINSAGGSAKVNTLSNYNHSQVQSGLESGSTNYGTIFSWLLSN